MESARVAGPVRGQGDDVPQLLQSILEREFWAFAYGDIISTITALRLGAYEMNPGPALLQGIHSIVWPLVLVAGLIGILVTARLLNRYYQNGIGIVLLPVPILIECQATLNNARVIGSLL